MRIGLIEFLLILAIASLTVGPRVALFVDRWMRRANRANAMAARRRAEYAAQMAAERDAMLKRFRTASTVFGVGILLVLVYALGFRPIDTPPQTYKAPDLRQETGAMQTAVSTDRKTRLELGEYQGVDCIRAKDGLLYAAAWNGAALKKRTSDLVRTDGGHAAAILSVEGELTGFAFDAAGDVWLTQLTTAGGTLCRAKHDSWGAAVEQVVTQRRVRCTLQWQRRQARRTGWKALCAPSCWRTPPLAACMCTTPPPAQWKRCWAGWQVLPVWRSARTAAPCMSPTLAAAAFGRWTPLPGS